MSSSLLIYASRVAIILAVIFLIVSTVISWFIGATWFTIGFAALGTASSVLSVALILMDPSDDW